METIDLAQATLSCPACAAVRCVAEIMADAGCACGATHHITYDFEKDALGLALHNANHNATLEGLGRRIEILASNLEAADPIASWRSPPHLDLKPSLAMALIGGGLALLGAAGADGAAEIGGVIILAGVGLGAYRWSNFEPMEQVYRRDLAISQANFTTAEYIRQRLEFYRELLRLTLQRKD